MKNIAFSTENYTSTQVRFLTVEDTAMIKNAT